MCRYGRRTEHLSVIAVLGWRMVHDLFADLDP